LTRLGHNLSGCLTTGWWLGALEWPNLSDFVDDEDQAGDSADNAAEDLNILEHGAYLDLKKGRSAGISKGAEFPEMQVPDTLIGIWLLLFLGNSGKNTSPTHGSRKTPPFA
jgi:hypothetical protein